MRYHWLILLILFIGCSGDPTTPTRDTDASPWLVDETVMSDSIDDYYKYDCAPYEVSDLWSRIYDIIGDKQYEAIYGGGAGEMEILTNPFGIKMIDGYPFEYQYGFLVEVLKDVNGDVYTRTVTMIVEPIDSFQRRIKGDEREGQFASAGLLDTNSWLSISDRYLPNHPATYFQFEQSPPDCAITTTESHGKVDVEGVGIDDLTIWAAWFYPTSYDEVEDEIGGYLRVQYTYTPTSTNFVQVWKMTLEQVD